MRLTPDDGGELYSEDPVRECMNRCLQASCRDAAIGDRAFYVRNGDQACGCATHGCDAQIGTYDVHILPPYTSYRISNGVWEAGDSPVSSVYHPISRDDGVAVCEAISEYWAWVFTLVDQERQK